MIIDDIQPSLLIEAIIENRASTRSVSSRSFTQIMKRLTSIKRLDLIDLQLTEEAQKSIPAGVRHLGLISHSPHAFCNVTDKVLKEILGRSQLDSFESKIIEPRDRARIRTDIAIKLPPGTYGRIAPRSGLAVNHFIGIGVVTDPDLIGGIKCILFNHQNSPFPATI